MVLGKLEDMSKHRDGEDHIPRRIVVTSCAGA